MSFKAGTVAVRCPSCGGPEILDVTVLSVAYNPGARPGYAGQPHRTVSVTLESDVVTRHQCAVSS